MAGTRSSGPAGNAQGQSGNSAGPIAAPATLQAPIILPGPVSESPPVHPGAPLQPGHQLPQSGNAPYLGYTREQLDARFAMEQRKFEADLVATEARTVREDKESRARIAAIQAEAVTTAAPQNRVDEEEPVGEISPAVLLVPSRYPGFPKAEIARIFANKFCPENLYKLRHLKRREDKDRDKNITFYAHLSHTREKSRSKVLYWWARSTNWRFAYISVYEVQVPYL